MARNVVTLTFAGDSRRLEKTIDGVQTRMVSLSARVTDIGKNSAKGGLLAGLGSGGLAVAGPLGAATAALGAFGAVATGVLAKHKNASKGISAAWGGITKALTPAVLGVTKFVAKLLRDAAPAITKLAGAGAKVVMGFLGPLDKLVSGKAFAGFISQFAAFGVQVAKLAGPQLVKLLAVLLSLFVQVMPSGMKILNVLLPLIVSLVSSLVPVIVVVAKVTAAIITWLQKTHLLLPVLALVAIAVLALGGPVWAIIAAIGVLVAVGVMLAKNWHTIWAKVQSILAGVWNWIKANWPLLLAILTGPIGLAVLFIIKHWSTLINGIKAGWNAVIAFIRQIPGWIIGALEKLGGMLYNFGHSVLMDMLNGLKSVAGSVWNWLTGWVKKLPGWIKSILHIRSPSGVFFNIGHMMMKGLEHGIIHGAKGAAAAARRTFTGLLGGTSAGAKYSGESSVALGRAMAAHVGWTGQNWLALFNLWQQESGWNPYAVNPSSGAYGIPQSLGHGHPFNLGDAGAQIAWGLNYIAGRYGSPLAAWAHELNVGWYNKGGFLKPGWNLAYNGLGRPEPVGAGAGSVNVYVQVAPGTHPAETGKAIADALAPYLARGGTINAGSRGHVQIAR